MTGRIHPAPVGDVLAELAAEYCEHDGVPGRCPMCRAAETAPDPPGDEPPPASPVPPRPPVPEVADGGREDARDTPWWQR